MDVSLVEGSEGSITLKAEENILENIEVTNNNGKLRIKTKDHVNLRPSWKKGIHIEIPVEEISKISINGSGEVTGNLTLKAAKLKLSINGSGDMKVAADATAIKAIVSGSADVHVNRDVATINKKVVGSGSVSKY